jgi:hypothetical protein
MLTKSMTAHKEAITANQKLPSAASVLRKLSHRIKMSSLACYFLVKLSVILSFRWNVSKILSWPVSNFFWVIFRKQLGSGGG